MAVSEIISFKKKNLSILISRSNRFEIMNSSNSVPKMRFLLECPKLEEARHDNLYNIENKYKNFKSLANVTKFIWLMSAEDTFIYSQLYQLLNKLNNLRHEILSNNN
jgi:hypothetical protein